MGFSQIFRIWRLSRGYFMGGLQQIFLAFETFDPKGTGNIGLPLHTSAILARFENVFNSLVFRIRGYEMELANWVFRQTEQSRYLAIGEMAALLVHDLSSPMHVMRFCLDELREDPSKFSNPKYIQFLTRAEQQCSEMVGSLKAYVRNPDDKKKIIQFGEAYKDIYSILKVQFHTRGLSKINFEIDPTLETLLIKVNRTDFMQILLNLLQNSVANMLDHNAENPKIAISLEATQSLNSQDAILFITDNGTGLSPQEFERLTAMMHDYQGSTDGRKGLGMRLIRRLVERYGGDLSVLQPSAGVGTCFRLKLPKEKGTT
jgi:signal transduction histidine kinase